jgi:hypothetical protein
LKNNITDVFSLFNKFFLKKGNKIVTSFALNSPIESAKSHSGHKIIFEQVKLFFNNGVEFLAFQALQGHVIHQSADPLCVHGQILIVYHFMHQLPNYIHFAILPLPRRRSKVTSRERSRCRRTLLCSSIGKENGAAHDVPSLLSLSKILKPKHLSDSDLRFFKSFNYFYYF